jgi:hypothetical protein
MLSPDFCISLVSGWDVRRHTNVAELATAVEDVLDGLIGCNVTRFAHRVRDVL